LCASDDTRVHIDRVDGPLDKTALGKGVRRRRGGLNARRPMTVTGCPACRVPERDDEGGIGQHVGPAGVLSDTHIVERGTPARAAACRCCSKHTIAGAIKGGFVTTADVVKMSSWRKRAWLGGRADQRGRVHCWVVRARATRRRIVGEDVEETGGMREKAQNDAGDAN
jgi:hypothetical protein